MSRWHALAIRRAAGFSCSFTPTTSGAIIAFCNRGAFISPKRLVTSRTAPWRYSSISTAIAGTYYSRETDTRVNDSGIVEPTDSPLVLRGPPMPKSGLAGLGELFRDLWRELTPIVRTCLFAGLG